MNFLSISGDRAFAFEEVVRTQASGGCVDHPGMDSFWLSNRVFTFLGSGWLG